jgi:hypothetical protein
MNKELLTKLYSTDPELLSKYHILAPNSAEVCAERTCSDLKEWNVDIKLIKKDNEIIGYYGIERLNTGMCFLTGFFLTPENRTKEQVTKFWNEVDSNFNQDYFVSVFKKNDKAIKFLNKKANMMRESNNVVVFRIGR